MRKAWWRSEEGVRKTWGRHEEGLMKAWRRHEECVRKAWVTGKPEYGWGHQEEDMRKTWWRHEKGMIEVWGRCEEDIRKAWGRHEEGLTMAWWKFEYIECLKNKTRQSKMHSYEPLYKVEFAEPYVCKMNNCELVILRASQPSILHFKACATITITYVAPTCTR